MHPGLTRLQPYPFERLQRLIAGVEPPADRRPILLSIGEPKHAPPPVLVAALGAALGSLGTYPATAGLPEFRRAAAGWLERRYGLGGAVDPDRMVLPVNGTREALFSIAQALVDPRERPFVAMPNPCYQIYEGAAILAGAAPLHLPPLRPGEAAGALREVPAEVWSRCALLYLCYPDNPTGAVPPAAAFEAALELAREHGFVLAADECYADIYLDEASPPTGFLPASRRLGRPDFENLVVFHSLSKRSSAPGLRSGFVAGDPRLIERYRLYRTYHGCALPVHVQQASIAAWNDDAHAAANRALYRAKFDAVLPILAPVLPVTRPAGGFYLWPDVGGDDEAFARELYAREHVLVLPGSYLGRDAGAGNPGRGRVRISLVAPLAECVEAAHRIRRHLESRTA
ncbi:MAG: succinyldiaminopimelate transaminase [Proteobacteria bacterium]|nr:succinyldiaminopimelate transaminase [Pseudomonadota bacterium]